MKKKSFDELTFFQKEDIFYKAIDKAGIDEFVKNKSLMMLMALAETNQEEYEILYNHIIIPTIFSHKFAKAFWGEENDYSIICVGKTGETAYDVVGFDWQYQLQQMVLTKEPLEYLSKFI